MWALLPSPALYTEANSMETKFQGIIDNVKAKARRLRRDGRRCCANQVLQVASYLKKELCELELAKKEIGS